VEISKKLTSPRRRAFCSAAVLASIASVALAACGPASSTGAAAGPGPGAATSAAPASTAPASTVPASSSPSVASSATTATASPSASATSASATPSSSASATGTPTASPSSASPAASTGSGTASSGTSNSGSGSGSASGASCTTTAAKGSCGPYSYAGITQGEGGTTTVGQDVWNPISGWSQSLHVTDPGNWYTTANLPKGNTAVVSFPNVGTTYPEPPLTNFSSIYSSFSENMHATSSTSAWAAFDIWLNKWGNEVMIQHDFANNGACPAKATATFGGSGGVPTQSWELCQYGSELIWKLTGGSEQSGSVDVLAMLQWLEDHSYLPKASTLTDISYGWEICSTGGQPETFNLSRFTVTAPEK
jgi:hypothetical protein